MDDEYIPVETFTCSYPGCGFTNTVAESIYIEGYGQICRRCDEATHGPRPEYWDLEPPF